MKGKVVSSNSKFIGCTCNLLIKRKKKNGEVVGSKLTRFMNNLPKKKKNHSLIALLELDGLKSITMGGIRFIYYFFL